MKQTVLLSVDLTVETEADPERIPMTALREQVRKALRSRLSNTSVNGRRVVVRVDSCQIL